MPKINFDVRGKVNGVNIELALDKQGDIVDVSEMTVYDLLENLNNGTLSIAINELSPHEFVVGLRNNPKDVKLEAYLHERDRNET